MIRIKNYLFKKSEIREIRGSDGYEKGIYITFVGGIVKFYSDISFDEILSVLNLEEK